MWRILSILQKNLVLSIPISIILGLVVGFFFDVSSLKNLIMPVTFIMVYPMMVTLNVSSVFKGKDYKLQLSTQVINLILIPAFAFFTGKLFLANGNEKSALWVVGLFLIGVLPTSGMTISWTGFAKGNKEAAIKMVLFGLIIGALAAPVYTKLFMGATIDVNMIHMFKQIALFVFMPLAAGLFTQYAMKKRYGIAIWNDRIKPKFPPFSALGVIMIAFLAMSLKARHIIANPGDIISIFLPLIVFYGVSYSALSVIGRLFFKRKDAVAMVFGVVMRNLSIALAIAMTAFGKQGLTIALLISLAYVIQIQSAAWYVRLVDKIFNKSDEKSTRQKDRQEIAKSVRIEKLSDYLPDNGPSMIPDIRKILYATDLSETASFAARYACSIGNKLGSEVSILHVIPDVLEELSSEAGIDLNSKVKHEEWKRLNQERFEKAKNAILNRIQKISRNLLKEIPHCPLNEERIILKAGNPAKQIVSTVKKENFDMVIMGTHGHGKLGEAMIGSITSEVMRHCSVPVTAIRLPQKNSIGYPPKPSADDENYSGFSKTEIQ